MSRPKILMTVLLAAAGGTLFCGPALAQSAGATASEARGLRYLSWSSRTEVAPPAVAAAAGAPAARRTLRRPNTVIPHGGFVPSASPSPRPGLTPAPGARRTLTPANAWMQPDVPPPEPLPPEPAMAAAPRSAPAPAPAPAPPSRATPDYLPAPNGRGQPVPAEMIYTPAPTSPPAQAGTEPLDPMAPRRDAPIFRLQPEAPSAPPALAPSVAPAVQSGAGSTRAPPQPRRVAEVSSSGERPPQQGGRYYSVHRQNGRQPDALEMPAPTYVDALVVTMPETIASQDLAAPEPGPTLIRDNQGRMRRAPTASDGDHQ